jgi:hypothetical protein
MHRVFVIALVVVVGLTAAASAQDLNAFRDDQINRLKNYVLEAIRPSGLVRDSVVLNGSSFHPATPDAAGFALLSLSALNHLDKLPDAEQRTIDILRAYAGQTPGVNPARSADGHWVHFMNVNTGAYACCWDDSYSPIGSALLVAGAQFAKNHFPNNTTIASLAEQLTASVNFNAAIHPSLDGRIYLDMTAAGGGSGGAVVPWNEYMLVTSLALRETNNSRALAVQHRWLDPDFILKKSYAGIPTLTDNPNNFAPAFWVQQMHFFNGDFRFNAEFEEFFRNQQEADQLYSSTALAQAFRYGLTAGLVPEPQVYHADRISNGVFPHDEHPHNVFSPEAVAAWGDMDTLLDFYNAQVLPPNDPRYKYGLVRVSAAEPSWIPPDAGLVDHLFLLFGLVESIDADFFKDRVFGAIPGDYNRDGVVDTDDQSDWQSNFGSLTDRGADGNRDGIVDAADYVMWRKLIGAPGSGGVESVPEPVGALWITIAVALCLPRRSRHWS